MNYLSEHNLQEYAVLEEKAAAATAHHNELSVQIKAAEKRMAEIAVLRTHIVNYAKTREVYVAYRKAGYHQAFFTGRFLWLLQGKVFCECVICSLGNYVHICRETALFWSNAYMGNVLLSGGYKTAIIFSYIYFLNGSWFIYKHQPTFLSQEKINIMLLCSYGWTVDTML